MTRRPSPLRPAPLLFAAAVLLAACQRPPPVPVPQAADRLAFALPAAEPARAAALERAVDGALCMRTSGRSDCDFGVCVALSPAQRAALRTRLSTAVQAVGRADLSSAAGFQATVRAAVPDARAGKVANTQGAGGCGTSGRACAAVRYDDLWMLASGPGQPPPARADSLTLFLARNPCAANPTGLE